MNYSILSPAVTTVLAQRTTVLPASNVSGDVATHCHYLNTKLSSNKPNTTVMDHAGFLKLLNETANKYGKAKPIFLENSVPAVQIRFFRNTGQMPTHAGQH